MESIKRFDPKMVIVTLAGHELTGLLAVQDAIVVEKSQEAIETHTDVTGSHVVVLNNDNSGRLTIKFKQHSESNKWLSEKFEEMKRNFGSFSPMTLRIKDLLNNDIVEGYDGFFSTHQPFTRGQGHNEPTWTIWFGKIDIDLKEGL